MLNTNKFIIIRPRKAENRLALTLVKDSGGQVVEKNSLGIVVQCKKWVGRQLSLFPLIRTEVLDIVLPQ